MENPKSADNKPMLLELEADKNYAWCACGHSQNQPWCNGAHKGSGMSPKVFKSEVKKKAALCMCKMTSNPPFCDGSHAKIS
jgi:CDGSH-type Zn-finger protein